MFDKMGQLAERTAQNLSRRQFVQRIGAAAAGVVAALSAVGAEAAKRKKCNPSLPNSCPTGEKCEKDKKGVYRCKK
jgi:hypothetical protein